MWILGLCRLSSSTETAIKSIASDYISLITERTGIQFEVVKGLTWPEAYDLAVSGDIDALPAISKTDEREQHFLSPSHTTSSRE